MQSDDIFDVSLALGAGVDVITSSSSHDVVDVKFFARSDFKRRKLRRFHDAADVTVADVDVGGVDERLLKTSFPFLGRFSTKTSESHRPRLFSVFVLLR